mmetsp:Transcript_40505/g.132298  ORF Transcript_40505/g.132298 Transcript_40505/m.132298 type:complete len:133 (+) Transcript_40505:846-1244(+)
MTPPHGASQVGEVARAVCACLLGTVGEARLAAFREEQRAEYETRGILADKERARALDFCFIDGSDQIRRVARECGTPSLLAAAVAGGGLAAAGGEVVAAEAEAEAAGRAMVCGGASSAVAAPPRTMQPRKMR